VSASVAYLGFTVVGHTLARATLVCPAPAPRPADGPQGTIQTLRLLR
jgi:hypothetical protein